MESCWRLHTVYYGPDVPASFIHSGFAHSSDWGTSGLFTKNSVSTQQLRAWTLPMEILRSIYSPCRAVTGEQIASTCTCMEMEASLADTELLPSRLRCMACHLENELQQSRWLEIRRTTLKNSATKPKYVLWKIKEKASHRTLNHSMLSTGLLMITATSFSSSTTPSTCRGML